MTIPIRISHSLAVALLITSAACGAADDENPNEEQIVEEQPANTATPQADAPAAPLTAADIEAYERGMSKEKQILEALVKKAEGTTDDQEKLNLMTEAMEAGTIDDGARAAGLSVEEYRQLRHRLDGVLGASASSIMGSALREQTKLSEAQIDTMAAQGLPPERIEEMRKSLRDMQAQYDTQENSSLEQIAPDARALFSQRVLRLDSLRLTTAALRIKVAS